MGFQDAVATCFRKYADFTGRARRSEYWWFFLFNLLMQIATGLVDAVLFGAEGQGLINLLYSLGVLLPGIAAGARRLHDIDRSAWWLLIIFVRWSASSCCWSGSSAPVMPGRTASARIRSRPPASARRVRPDRMRHGPTIRPAPCHLRFSRICVNPWARRTPMATHGLPAWPWAGTPTEDLPPPERLLLEGARLWAVAAREGHPPLPAPRLPFLTEGAEAALLPLDALMRALGGALPPACPLCPCIAPQEATLLLGCALIQRGARREALALLLRHLPPATAYAVMPAAIHLGIALGRAGLLLRNPLRPVQRG